MAANTIVTTARRASERPRMPVWRPLMDSGAHPDPVAGAAARTAPRGPGLATVTALPVRRPDLRADGTDASAVGTHSGTRALCAAPALTRPTRPVLRTVALLATVALLVGGVLRAVIPSAEGPVVAGHVVLQPGETLWDIAVRSAPTGVDPRRQIDSVRRLNGFGPGALDAWTVVLIPAP